MRKKDSSGFTLIQLVVVILTVSILTAIAVRKLTEVRDRAKIGAAQADAISMRSAVALYEAEHGSYKVGTGSYAGVDGYESFKSNLKTLDGTLYVLLPDTTNFYPTNFSYIGDNFSFTIKIKARDSNQTAVLCTSTQLSTVSQTPEANQ